VFERDDRRRLLAIARRALEARVRRQYEPALEQGGALETQRVALETQCGAFVSIHRGHELRGCLGRLGDDWPIARVVAHLGRVVADSDPRFAPVTAEDLDTLSIEISALSPEREVRSVQDIQIGRHGLIIEQGHRRGLLLPQVATEHGWDVETFLEHTCLKAGLPPDAWKHDARILIFEAEVFGEADAVDG
jgi:AmmeMemoRadiSam system protein A